MLNPYTDLCGTLAGRISGDSFFDENFFEEDIEEEVRLFGNDPFWKKYRDIDEFSCEDGLFYENPEETEKRIERILVNASILMPSAPVFSPFKNNFPCSKNFHKLFNINEIYFPRVEVSAIFIEDHLNKNDFEDLEKLPSTLSSRKSAIMLTGHNFGLHKVQKAHPIEKTEDQKKNHHAVITGKTAPKKRRLKKNRRQSVKTMCFDLGTPKYSISSYPRDMKS